MSAGRRKGDVGSERPRDVQSVRPRDVQSVRPKELQNRVIMSILRTSIRRMRVHWEGLVTSEIIERYR